MFVPSTMLPNMLSVLAEPPFESRKPQHDEPEEARLSSFWSRLGTGRLTSNEPCQEPAPATPVRLTWRSTCAE